MGTTIKDIAKIVGVSPSTVSRVLNDTASISEETKNKIYKTIKEMDYHPNSGARNLAHGSTRTIGLVVNAEDEKTFSNSFFNRSVYAIENIMQSQSYNLLITNDSGDEKSPISMLVYEKKVDGLIVPPSSMNERLFNFLTKEKFPYVVLGQPELDDTNISWVDIDNAEGSKKAVEHLKGQGYKHIAIVVENSATIFSKKRIEGYKQSISENTEVLIIESTSLIHDESIITAVKGGSIDAFICADNEIAYHMLCLLKQESINVPGQVGIVTFDNYPLAEYMDPPLTAIDVNTFLLGERAAQLLISTLRKNLNENVHELIGTNIIVRRSSKRKGDEE